MSPTSHMQTLGLGQQTFTLAKLCKSKTNQCRRKYVYKERLHFHGLVVSTQLDAAASNTKYLKCTLCFLSAACPIVDVISIERLRLVPRNEKENQNKREFESLQKMSWRNYAPQVLRQRKRRDGGGKKKTLPQQKREGSLSKLKSQRPSLENIRIENP